MFTQGRWYVGHLGPIPLYVHWSVAFLVYLVFTWFGNDSRGIDWASFLVALTWVAAGIICHEFGHGIVAKWNGATGITITIEMLGGVCSSQRQLKPWRELAILAAGPLVNFLFVGLCYGGLAWMEQAHPIWYQGDMRQWVDLWLGLGLWINLALALFNCLPIYPLDGGQIAFNGLLLATRRPPLAALITFVLACVTAAAYLWWRWSTISPLTLMIVGLCLFNAWQLVVTTRDSR
ncbi:MAG: site-2 protease family protein [Planctomycetes bacterium]|nr:site-2 protease family protein [Planctomycetota bacterium]